MMGTPTFKVENYITVPGFAIVELGLSGNELLCYSLIYGFTQDKETEFRGSLNYVASALNVTKQNAKKIIDRLIDRGLIEKHEVFFSGVKFCHYIANRHGVAETATGEQQNSNGGVAETATGGMAETATNNTDIDKTIDKIKDNADGGLFDSQADFKPVVVTAPGKRGRKSKEKIPFEETEYFGNPKKFCERLAETGEFPSNTNYQHYYFSAMDWSAKGGRYAEWVAGVRNWIRSDAQKGQLAVMKGSALSSDAMEYLKDMAEI